MRLLLEHALLPHGVRQRVLVEIDRGRFNAVLPDAGPEQVGGAEPVPGLTVPGFANAHSHAFHRALRAHTQRERGTFWTWREQMYSVAARLTPERYHQLAEATYREMVAAGFTSVGEFHYLHHAPDGTPYADSGRAHAMEQALVAAATGAGIRLTLLDTCYLSSGFGATPTGAQVRFSDGTVGAWRDRVEALRERLTGGGVRLGVAVHSVRALAPADIEAVARYAHAHDLPLHVHLSEQVAENDGCLAAHGLTPTALLARCGALGERTTLVHATHLTSHDIARIGAVGAHVCFCPTTERDLGDGIGPSRALAAAGARLTIGSDSHAVIDPFEEVRAVETDERLATRTRGHWSATELVEAGTVTGHASLGWDDVGTLTVGQRADLVTLDLTSPRTAGCNASAETVVFAATSADVERVWVGGAPVLDAATGDRDRVGRALAAALTDGGPAATGPEQEENP